MYLKKKNKIHEHVFEADRSEMLLWNFIINQ